jgi:hypothetical protein
MEHYRTDEQFLQEQNILLLKEKGQHQMESYLDWLHQIELFL